MVDLKNLSLTPIHFVAEDILKEDFNFGNLMIFNADISDVNMDEELFALISSAINFPDYFGKNWDALGECLNDMEWLPSEGYMLVLYGSAKGWANCPYTHGKFLTTWLEAAQEWKAKETPFHLIYVM